MNKFNFEKPDAVFLYAPVIEDICIELGVDRTDTETITCMYEVFKRVSGHEKQYSEDDESYQEGYREGYNDAISEAESRIDDLSWEVGRLKKN